MKPKEFYKIMEDFIIEDKRWRALKIGDAIYEAVGRGFDTDYHKMIIDKIDIEERTVYGHDAQGNHASTIGNFLTGFEFIKKQYDKP
jgi:hypothetical protein